MKKSLSNAMAVAMAFGTVVPAYATGVQTQVEKQEVDMLKVAGVKGTTQVLTRVELYNFNGASADETSKHTIKSQYKDYVILAEKTYEDAKGNTDASKDMFLVGQTSDESLSDAKIEKAKYEKMIKEIQIYTEDLGYSIVDYKPEEAKGDMKAEDLAEAFGYRSEIVATDNVRLSGKATIPVNGTLKMNGKTLTVSQEGLVVEGTLDVSEVQKAETGSKVQGVSGATIVVAKGGKVVGEATLSAEGTYTWNEETKNWDYKQENIVTGEIDQVGLQEKFNQVDIVTAQGDVTLLDDVTIPANKVLEMGEHKLKVNTKLVVEGKVNATLQNITGVEGATLEVKGTGVTGLQEGTYKYQGQEWVLDNQVPAPTPTPTPVTTEVEISGEIKAEELEGKFDTTIATAKAIGNVTVTGATGTIPTEKTVDLQENELLLQENVNLKIEGVLKAYSEDKIKGSTGAVLEVATGGKVELTTGETSLVEGKYEWNVEEGVWKATPSVATVQAREIGGETTRAVQETSETVFPRYTQVVRLENSEGKVRDYVFENVLEGESALEGQIDTTTSIEKFIESTGIKASKGVQIKDNKEVNIYLAEEKDGSITTAGTVADTMTEISDGNVYVTINRLKYALEKQGANITVEKDEFGTDNGNLKLTVTFKDIAEEDATQADLVINLYQAKLLDESKIVKMPNLENSDFKGHWAEDTILNAMVSGYVDASETFRPKDGVTRAEFTKMLCTVFGLDVTNLGSKFEPFTDVSPENWYYKYVVALYNANGEVGTIINGYEDGTFKPNDKITRQEAAKMVANMHLQLDSQELRSKMLVENKDGDFVKATSLDTEDDKVKSADYVITANGMKFEIDSLTSFTDDKEIKNWADGAVSSLNKAGVIKGYEDGTFKPTGEITRVEALLMITGDNRK